MENTNIKLPEGWLALSYIDYNKLFSTLTDLLKHTNSFSFGDIVGLIGSDFYTTIYYVEEGKSISIGCDPSMEDDEDNELDGPVYKPYIKFWDVDDMCYEGVVCYLEVNDNVKSIVETILHAIEHDLDIEVQVEMWRELNNEPPIEISAAELEELI